jgi:hypothetical protein
VVTFNVSLKWGDVDCRHTFEVDVGGLDRNWAPGRSVGVPPLAWRLGRGLLILVPFCSAAAAVPLNRGPAEATAAASTRLPASWGSSSRPPPALLEEHLGERAQAILRKSTQDEQETLRKLFAEIVEQHRYVGKIWMRNE